MSDFLTNLVVRSFSRTPSFQPVMATAADPVQPEEHSTEPLVSNTDQTNQEESVPSIETSIVIPAPTPPQPIIHREIVHAAPEKSVSSPVLETPIPPKQEFKEEPPAKPEPTRDVKTEQLVVPTPPVHDQPSKRQSPLDPVKPISAPPVQAAPSGPSAPSKPRVSPTKARKAEPPIVEQVIEQVTEHVTEQTIHRPIVKRTVMIENSQEITNSFTTLVPKPSAQPLPSVNTKTRPKLPAVQAPEETEPVTALPPETVINVAIGRIEVRATPAAAQKRERQSPGPKVMTLDDYVQQRSRGAK